MKFPEEVVNKINNILIMNYEAEKMYLDALDKVEDDELKSFFRERGFERNEFARALRHEIIKLGIKPQDLGRLSARFHLIWKDIRPLLKPNHQPELLDQICNLKMWNINNYNRLLQEINLPLSFCKLLASQRDDIQSNMHAIKAQEAFVV